MKKVIACSVAAASFAFGASDAQILELFSAAKDQGLSVTIDSKTKVADGKFEQIVIKISDGTQSQNQVLFSDGKYLFPDIIDTDKKLSYANEFNDQNEKATMKVAYKNLAEVIKSLDKSKIITLGNDPAKATKYLFTDPLCPYCRLELADIEKELETSNLKVILAPIQSHGIEAVKKSIAIMNEVKGLKNDSDKIKIFRKYFAEDAKTPTGISDEQVKKEQKNIMRYFETGAIRGVPAFVNESDLK